ncbi:MAG: hypothetical protein KIC78_05205, partial [Prevotella sp.]|uniref:hypothetical protein n=1 Tax=Prevotella sp. TaxID=59823 RepID=UPI00257A36D4
SAQGASALKSGCKSTGFSPNRQMFSEKSFNFRLILTVIYILSMILTPFTLLYFTKEESKLVTQEREIRPDGKDENHTQMANIKDRWQNLKVFESQRKKTAGRLPVTTADATVKPVMEQIYS